MERTSEPSRSVCSGHGVCICRVEMQCARPSNSSSTSGATSVSNELFPSLLIINETIGTWQHIGYPVLSSRNY